MLAPDALSHYGRGPNSLVLRFVSNRAITSRVPKNELCQNT
jgi:hypothetical protein